MCEKNIETLLVFLVFFHLIFPLSVLHKNSNNSLIIVRNKSPFVILKCQKYRKITKNAEIWWLIRKMSQNSENFQMLVMKSSRKMLKKPKSMFENLENSQRVKSVEILGITLKNGEKFDKWEMIRKILKC